MCETLANEQQTRWQGQAFHEATPHGHKGIASKLRLQVSVQRASTFSIFGSFSVFCAMSMTQFRIDGRIAHCAPYSGSLWLVFP